MNTKNNRRRLLCTGHAGFIGSNLCKRFLAEGWDVTGVDDLSTGRVPFVPEGVDSYFCDFTAPVILEKIKRGEFETVCHLAAKPRVSYSVEHPAETNDINVARTVKLLEACRGNVNRFINTSSSSVYGGAKNLPTPETTPHNPQSPYALQKSITEAYCRMFSHLYGLDTVSVRPFNVFGPNQVIDENSAYATACANWLYSAKHGLPFRSDGTGLQTRDLTHVDNVVDVFYRIAIHDGKFDGRAFNAGTGSRYSNQEVLDLFKKHYPDTSVTVAPVRAGDVLDTQADMTEASIILGWKLLMPFWKGLEMTREWAMTCEVF